MRVLQLRKKRRKGKLPKSPRKEEVLVFPAMISQLLRSRPKNKEKMILQIICYNLKIRKTQDSACAKRKLVL